MTRCGVWRLALLCTLGVGSAATALDLPDVQEMRTALRRSVRERQDCIAWYDFADPEASGLTYANSGDELEVLPGRSPERKAARLFHGALRGKLVDVPATGFTLCCWLRVKGFDQTSRNPHGCVMSMGDGWRDGWRMILRPREGQKAILVFTVGRPGGGVGVNCGGRFTMGEWHHVAVTWDRETLAIWIDGIVRTQALVTMPYTPPTKRPEFGIGACGTDGLGALDMEIADLAFFSIALPADVLKRLHNPDAAYEQALAQALAGEVPVPPANATPEQEQTYRGKLKPFLTRPDAPNTTLVRAVRAIAGLRIADSFRRAGQFDEARRAYAALAGRADAPLHCRARAMLAAGDMHRDAKRYEAARREYEKTRDFFTGKREAFRVDALERLRDIETLADGAPFKDQRARRIERISHATPWFFVASDGDDATPGTAQRPFRTLERARDAVRERRKKEALPAGGVAVMLKGGVYPRESHSFALSAEDSGTAESPIIYQAVAGERAVIRGGRAIQGFKPLTDPAATKRIPEPARQHVVQADLEAQGVAHFGELRVRGPRSYMKDPECPAHLELFFNGRPMSLARWPNDTTKMSERFAAVEAGDQKLERKHLENPDFFSYSNPRQDRWANEPDGWLFGYWNYMWNATYAKIGHVDPKQRLIHIAWELTASRQKQRAVGKGAPYVGVNLLCELDSPGEWYLDRSTGLLFFWPPSPVDKAEAVVSVLEKPLFTLDDTSHVVFRRLVFEAGRKHGVVINGGAGVLLAGCVVRNMGVDGVVINGGRNHEVVGCDVAYTGDSGVKMYGGNIESLTPSGHVVDNCHIHHVARWNRSGYGPGIKVGQASSAEQAGVGCRISRCLIHDTPMYGIRVHGNDNIVEYSEIHDVCHEAGDAGAFNMYGAVVKRALLERGNVLRYNYWHHLPQDETFKGVHMTGRMGIYIDSMNGSITVYGNVFQKCDYSVGTVYFGTCDSHVENNLFHRCFRGVRFSDRSYLYNKVNKAPNFVMDVYLAKAAANPVWARRYPRLTTYPPRATDMSVFLMGNVVARNIAVDCGPLVSGVDKVIDHARIEWNWTEGDPGFKDLDGGDFTLDPQSPALVAAAFEPLPFKQMGLYNDELRASWPVEHEIGVYKTALKEANFKRKARTKMPICAARSCTAKIVVDGRLDAAEWGRLDKAHAIELKHNPHGQPSKAIPSYVWVRRNEADLFIAILNELNPDEKPTPRKDEKASWFLDADIVELMFEGDAGIASTWWPAVKRHGPVFYLAGDCAGSFDSIAVGDMPKPRAEGLQVAVTYAAVSEPGRWTAEWRIPLKALCLDPKQTPSCCFNVGVHKPGTRSAKKGEKVTYLEHWVKWTGDPVSQAWAVWNAGYLRLKTDEIPTP